MNRKKRTKEKKEEKKDIEKCLLSEHKKEKIEERLYLINKENKEEKENYIGCLESFFIFFSNLSVYPYTPMMNDYICNSWELNNKI